MPVARQLTVSTEDRLGRLAEVASLLGEKGVNILALWAGVAGGRWAVRLIVDDHARAMKEMEEQACWDVSEENVLTVPLADKPGSVGAVARRLEQAGLNIEYAYSSPARASGSASAYFGIVDMESALKALGETEAAA